MMGIIETWVALQDLFNEVVLAQIVGFARLPFGDRCTHVRPTLAARTHLDTRAHANACAYTSAVAVER